MNEEGNWSSYNPLKHPPVIADVLYLINALQVPDNHLTKLEIECEEAKRKDEDNRRLSLEKKREKTLKRGSQKGY